MFTQQRNRAEIYKMLKTAKDALLNKLEGCGVPFRIFPTSNLQRYNRMGVSLMFWLLSLILEDKITDKKLIWIKNWFLHAYKKFLSLSLNLKEQYTETSHK